MDPIMSGTDVPTASTSTPITIALTFRMQAAPVASATCVREKAGERVVSGEAACDIKEGGAEQSR